MLDILTTASAPPKIDKLDNEASNLLKQALIKQKIKYQLVPPHIHQHNMAERAIKTFKAHFLARLCTTDPEFPAREWGRLIPHAVLTLNHLHNSRINPKRSSHAAIFGTFDLNKCPLAPPGMCGIVHEKADNQLTWAPHGTDSWYIGPSFEHYCWVKIFMPTYLACEMLTNLHSFDLSFPSHRQHQKTSHVNQLGTSFP